MDGASKSNIWLGERILHVAGGRELSPQGLLPGDLIFKYTGEQLLHVSIVTSVDAESGAADHAHHLNDGAWTGLHETTVSTAGNLVVRCRNPALRKSAAAFASQWTALAMPYSNHRRILAMVHEEKSGAGVVAAHRKLFDEIGKFRAIKFTARRNGDLIYPSEKTRESKAITACSAACLSWCATRWPGSRVSCRQRRTACGCRTNPRPSATWLCDS